MKKITILLMTICCMFIGVFSSTVTAFATGNNTVIVFEGAKQEENKVSIDVNVKENSGVYSMLLTLDYDRAALTLCNISYGEALSSLEPLASENYSVNPYKISYLGKEKSNDSSTGKMMTITFIVNEKAKDGEYSVTFGYTKNKDITYLSEGEIQTKNLVVSGAKVTLKNSGVESVVTEANSEKNNDGGGTIPIIVAASVATLSLVSLIVVLILRKKKRTWTKI